jgi:hypothetical protein
VSLRYRRDVKRHPVHARFYRFSVSAPTSSRTSAVRTVPART